MEQQKQLLEVQHELSRAALTEQAKIQAAEAQVQASVQYLSVAALNEQAKIREAEARLNATAQQMTTDCHAAKGDIERKKAEAEDELRSAISAQKSDIEQSRQQLGQDLLKAQSQLHASHSQLAAREQNLQLHESSLADHKNMTEQALMQKACPHTTAGKTRARSAGTTRPSPKCNYSSEACPTTWTARPTDARRRRWSST